MRTIVLFITLVFLPGLIFASTDGIYGLNKNLNSTWDGTDASLIATPTLGVYDYAYGDEAHVTFELPKSWPSFTFYGQAYTQITADTNGNIWFGSAGSANSFILPSTGPVISAWNNDLSSYFTGGVFVQYKSNPERVVIEWQAESYTDEGMALPNNFEVVLFPNGDIRIDYKTFSAANAKDFGSGISSNDITQTHYLSITSAFFPVNQLSGNSYGFTTSISSLQVNFTGTGGGIVTSSPDGIACNTNCSSTFPTGEQITLHPAADQYSLFKEWAVCSGTLVPGTDNCLVTLNTDTAVTATFDIKAAQISGTFYQSVQDAYNNALTGDTIYAWDTTFSNGLICDQPRDVTILGGYDKIYSVVTGTTKLSNPLIIQQGSVRVSNLAIVDGASLPVAPMISTITTTAITSPSLTLTSGPAVIRNKNSSGKNHGHDKDKDDDHGHRSGQED